MAKVMCSCGTRIVSPRAMLQHKRGVWHPIAREARKLRAMGMSYSEVARHVKLKRMIVWLRLKEERL